MLETIANLAVIIFSIAAAVCWIRLFAASDGTCRGDTCDGCPYSESCPEGYCR